MVNENAFIDVDIYRRYFIPRVQKSSSLGIVFCNTLFAEMNKSRHFIVMSCRKLAIEGYCTCFFDYRGTGESLMDSCGMSFNSVVDDLDTIISTMIESYLVKNIIVIGFRGGALAALLSKHHAIKQRILWEPIKNGKELTKVGRITSITSGDSTQKNDSEVLLRDIGGWFISQRFYNELSKWKLDDVNTQANISYRINFISNAVNATATNDLNQNVDRVHVDNKFWYFGGRYFSSDAADLTHGYLKSKGHL